MGKRRWTDEHPDDPPRTSQGPRQRSARTDPSMRQGDSGQGNPLENETDFLSTDNDAGDAFGDIEPEAGHAGGAIGGTPAGKRTRSHIPHSPAPRTSRRGDSTIGSK